MHIYIHTYKYAYTHARTCVTCTCMYIWIHKYIQLNMHICIHIFIHVYRHTCRQNTWQRIRQMRGHWVKGSFSRPTLPIFWPWLHIKRNWRLVVDLLFEATHRNRFSCIYFPTGSAESLCGFLPIASPNKFRVTFTLTRRTAHSTKTTEITHLVGQYFHP